MGEAGEGSSLKPKRAAQARHSDALGKLEGAAGLVSTIASLRGNDSAKAPLRTLPNNVQKDVVNMVKSMGGRPERTRHRWHKHPSCVVVQVSRGALGSDCQAHYHYLPLPS